MVTSMCAASRSPHRHVSRLIASQAARLLTVVILNAGAAATVRAAVVPLEPCAVTIDLSSTVALQWTSEDARRFREEAGRVWSHQGVALCWRDQDTSCPASQSTVHVRLAQNVPSNGLDAAHVRAALGWIGFSDRTGPGPFIVLSVSRAMELLGQAERTARRLADLPGMVARLLPRALGRALSHELGHFLLARRAHSRTGVMRAGFRPEDLADEGSGQRMELPHDDKRALAQRCRETLLRVAAAASAPPSRRPVMSATSRRQ